MQGEFIGWELVFVAVNITVPRKFIHETITIVDDDRVDDDTRWLLFIYLTKVKGVKYRELGITPAVGNMIKTGADA